MSAPSPSPAAPQPRRIARIARKPLKLASSAIRPLTRSSTPTPASVVGTGASGEGSGSSGAGNDLLDSNALTPTPSTSRNPLKRISSRGASGASAHANSSAAFDPTPSAVVKSVRGPRKPLAGEEPAAVVRVRVVRAEGLVARDKNGLSDPFVTLLLPPGTKQSTPHIKKTLDPVFPPEQSTLDFPIYLSMASVVVGRGLEAVIWDKDMLRKEYMGELSLPLVEWFPTGTVALMDDKLPVITRRVVSTRRKQDVSGTLSLQVGFLPPKDATSPEDALQRTKDAFARIVHQGNVARSAAGVLAVPAHKGIGTIKLRSRRKSENVTIGTLSSTSASVLASMAGGHRMVPVQQHQDIDDDDDDAVSLADDGLSSSSSSDELDSGGEDDDAVAVADGAETPGMTTPHHPKRRSTDKSSSSVDSPAQSTNSTEYFDRERERRESSPQDLSVPPTPASGISTGTGAATPGGSRRPFFLRGRGSKASSMDLVEKAEKQDQRDRERKAKKEVKSKSSSTKKKKKRGGFNLDAEHGKDILGIVVMEIKSADDLPRIKNTLRVSYDMDPFVVISFGKKVFRTRVIRHSLNPVWDEKMLFHVRRHESNYTMQFAVLDWDNVSGNDSVGSCVLPLSELIADAPKPGENGLYSENEDGKHDFKEFCLPIMTEKDMPWESKHSPKLTLRAKYEPYDALRQRFWRQYITQYDVDETQTLSYTELSAMLDSLGSTLTHKTIEGFFRASGKDVDGELSMEEVILQLERAVTMPREEKRKVSTKANEAGERAGEDGLGVGAATPGLGPGMAPEPSSEGLGMTGPQGNISRGVDAEELAEHILESTQREEDDKAGNLRSVQTKTEGGVPDIRLRKASMDVGAAPPAHVLGAEESDLSSTSASALEASPMPSGLVTPTFEDGGASDMDDSDVDADADADSSEPDDRERVINIRTCPLCHRPRLKKRSEQDIITHLAICASSDWSRVDRIVTANYVTSSQAQRKFLTRMMNKVTIGAYSLGANSANILVQDRMTGQLQEEKMAVYVRLGIRVLYKGWKSQMEGGRARRLLKSLSIKQGQKYDNPDSRADILPFIAFHNLNVDEILDPLDSFKTFNEFFYRKLKREARPVEEPDNEGRLVSCADCRMMAFETVGEATRIWIKGREFGVPRLLGDEYKGVWDRYEGGALAIFRLAPQDYHRFHSPVRGRVGKMTLIDGEYYTVNPQAVRTALDVYGENVRKVVPIESEEFGTVMTVWVGAMMVGSIATTVQEGQMVERGDELGYFAFGGSTIVCVFERGAVKWDGDLVGNGQAAIETLVRMGMGIGTSARGK